MFRYEPFLHDFLQKKRLKRMARRRCGDRLVVAAIDFGTTYSGYAYSFKNEFEKNPLEIRTCQKWQNSAGLNAYKVPSSILFDNEGTFKSFGFTAETEYNDLVDEEMEQGWRFFRRFKMSLYRKMNTEKGGRLCRNLKLKDEQGRRMSAMDVFSAAILFLKDHFLTTLKDAFVGIKPDDVHWILTVPAIWSDAAKQFMREAAKKAGIKDNQLDLALEPEAAAVYCKEITVKTKSGKEGSKELSAFSPGEKFLLIDIGGGTVDITCHQVLNDGTLKEIHPPTGGPWGGTVVDEEYFCFLEDLIGREAWKDFLENNKSEKLELESEFEKQKRDLGKDDKISLKVGAIFTKACKKINAKYSSTVEVLNKKLKVDKSVVIGFFESPMNDIIEHVERMFMKRSLRSVSTILMVGGFSESDLMKERIEQAFPGKNIIRPFDASIAVLKGAVIFGHLPQTINERTSPRTYGVCVSVPFDSKVHPKKNLTITGGCEMATDIFRVMVKIGQPVKMGTTKVEHVFRPASKYDTVATVELYESTEESPKYTNDPRCRRLGILEVQIPDTTKGKERRIVVAAHFGHTELKFTAAEEGTNHKAEATFDCLT